MSQFWKDAIERAIKTGVQVILVAASGNQLVLFSLDMKQILLLALSSAILSLLTSYASSSLNDENSASLIKHEEKS